MRDPDKLAKGEFGLKFEFVSEFTEAITPAISLTMVESLIYFEVNEMSSLVLANKLPKI